jgi:hypothetical protein
MPSGDQATILRLHCAGTGANRRFVWVNGLPNSLAMIATASQSAAAYSAYQNTCGRAVSRGTLKMTREPVELTWINCARKTLFVLMQA